MDAQERSPLFDGPSIDSPRIQCALEYRRSKRTTMTACRLGRLRSYERAARSALPLLTAWQPAVLGRSMTRFSRLLPLASDGRSVDLLLGVADEL